MENKNTRESFKGMLKKKDNSDKKTLSLSLPNTLLQEIDELCETIASISGQHVTRQSIIETGLSAYVNDFKDYIQEEYRLKLQLELYEEAPDEVNTLIVPAHAEGIETLLNKEWYWLRIGKDKLDKIKYLAVYFGAPISAITHISKVEKLEKYPSGYKAILSEVTELSNPVTLGNLNAQYVRPNRYVSKERILNAKGFADLVDFE